MFRKLSIIPRVWGEFSDWIRFRSSFRRAYFKVKKGIAPNDWRSHFHADFSPIIFLSTGRCGTDFIRSILLLDTNLDVYHEPLPRLGYASKYAYDNNLDVKALSLGVLSARFEHFSTSYLLGRGYIETNNRMTFFSRGILSLFPSTKFIYITRHPAAFVRSGIRRGYSEEDNAILMDGKISVKSGNALMGDIEKVAALWNETNQYIEDFLVSVPESQVMRLRAEDCFQDVAVLHRLFEFSGGKNWNSSKVKKLITKPRNSQKDGSFPRYEDWTSDMKDQLAKQAILAGKYDYML